MEGSGVTTDKTKRQTVTSTLYIVRKVLAIVFHVLLPGKILNIPFQGTVSL